MSLLGASDFAKRYPVSVNSGSANNIGILDILKNSRIMTTRGISVSE